LLESDERVAEKDRLYAPGRMVEHKEALERSAERWKDLFSATFDVLLYDLTSTTEGEAEEVEKARRATRAIIGLTASRSLCAGGHPEGFSSPTKSSRQTELM